MTAAQVDILALVREYADAVERAIYSQPGSDEEARWITAGAKVYAKLATIFQRYEYLEHAARSAVQFHKGSRVDTMYIGSLENALWALERVCSQVEQQRQSTELDDTQPVDTDAINAALEPLGWWRE